MDLQTITINGREKGEEARNEAILSRRMLLSRGRIEIITYRVPHTWHRLEGTVTTRLPAGMFFRFLGSDLHLPNAGMQGRCLWTRPLTHMNAIASTPFNHVSRRGRNLVQSVMLSL